jgi:hypothetical protein
MCAVHYEQPRSQSPVAWPIVSRPIFTQSVMTLYSVLVLIESHTFVVILHNEVPTMQLRTDLFPYRRLVANPQDLLVLTSVDLG